jgi:hypothetical protein
MKSSFPSGGIQGAYNFSKWMEGVEETSSKCCKFSSVQECFLNVKCVNKSSSSCWRFQCWSLKKCVKESSSSYWEFRRWNLRCVQNKFLKLLKVSSFKCVKESSLPMLQVSSQILDLCKKVSQVFEGFL